MLSRVLRLFCVCTDQTEFYVFPTKNQLQTVQYLIHSLNVLSTTEPTFVLDSLFMRDTGKMLFFHLIPPSTALRCSFVYARRLIYNFEEQIQIRWDDIIPRAVSFVVVVSMAIIVVEIKVNNRIDAVQKKHSAQQRRGRSFATKTVGKLDTMRRGRLALTKGRQR